MTKHLRERERERNLMGHHLFHIGLLPPSSRQNLYGYFFFYFFFTMVLNNLYDICIWTCSHHLLMMHYQYVEGNERVWHTFISWYAICEHNTNFLIFMVLLLFCIYFWFHDLKKKKKKKKKKKTLTLIMLQMCSETTKLIFNISKCICFSTQI